MSEKLCLQWNDFQENLQAAFKDLRGDKNFTDVTLACDDGQQVEAHRLILALSSPLFQKLLEKSKHPHPLIYMRGLKSEDLMAIVDFLYFGEANVLQENLDSFLAIAEELRLKGLMGKSDAKMDDTFNEKRQYDQSVKFQREPIMKNDFKPQQLHQNMEVQIEAESRKTIALSGQFAGYLELDEKVKSLMEKSENLYANGRQKAHKCKVCGKEGKGNVIKAHIEANHLEGIVIPCNHCEKTFRCRISQSNHMRNDHKSFH